MLKCALQVMLFIQINLDICTLDSFHSCTVKLLQEFHIKGYNIIFICDKQCPYRHILIIQEIVNNVCTLCVKKGGNPPIPLNFKLKIMAETVKKSFHSRPPHPPTVVIITNEICQEHHTCPK